MVSLSLPAKRAGDHLFALRSAHFQRAGKPVVGDTGWACGGAARFALEQGRLLLSGRELGQTDVQ